MSSIFCCSSITPYRPRRLDHESKFSSFMGWAKSDPTEPANGSSLVSGAPYGVQVVRQVNFGPQESIRYFVADNSSSVFLESSEQAFIQANFEKLNSYKNFKCQQHNKFFEVNLYQKDPFNAHHWRANLARPSRDIDLQFRESTVLAPIQDFPPSDVEQTTSSPKPDTPGVARQLNQAHSLLKSMLQFLLPRAGANLGSNSLLSLLCLDWVNRELDLGLDHDNLWKAHLSSSNISIFLNSCIDPASRGTANIDDIEDLVIHAMDHEASTEGDKLPGRVKLENIVNQVLESNMSTSWVSQNETIIKRALTSGPSEEILASCRSGLEEPPGNRLQHVTAADPARRSLTRGKFLAIDDNDDYDDYERSYDYDFDRGSSPGNDYAACDKECGYCAVLAIFASQATATRTPPHFQRWYPSYQSAIQLVISNHCGEALHAYQNGTYKPGCAVCVPNDLIICILNNSDEAFKANLAAVAVLLGLLPSILSLAGSSTVETGLLFMRRPVLSLLLAAGSPAISPIRTFDHRDPIETLHKRPDALHIPHLGKFATAIVLSLQYLLSAVSIANIYQLSWQFGRDTVTSFAPDTIYFPGLWAILTIPIHLFGAWAVIQRFRCVEIQQQENKALTFKSTLKRKLSQEFTLNAHHSHSSITPRKETFLFICFSWFTSISTILHIIAGVFIFSSTLFIGVTDAWAIAARYLASVVICRIILMFEISGMRTTVDVQGIHSTEVSVATQQDGLSGKPRVDANEGN
ncbi:hypothetical protein O1611_g370 [Lasiodiplodia mahajangana]|uniref:Uncharacterized protein n=1 Tax=Lasiodiplodia mahajangana TaxID=1108764 RepID=A0ACC2K0J5_9PEZI|nr:hypothetical protein O1611_g370 [Lasiodiplodia mahajangana]